MESCDAYAEADHTWRSKDAVKCCQVGCDVIVSTYRMIPRVDDLNSVLELCLTDLLAVNIDRTRAIENAFLNISDERQIAGIFVLESFQVTSRKDIQIHS